MNDILIHYYEFPQGQPPDFVALKALFKNNITKQNVPYFEAKSESECKFLDYCASLNIAHRRQTVVEYGGSASTATLLYFCVTVDDDNWFKEDEGLLKTFDNGCPGGGIFGECHQGAAQIGELAIRPNMIKKLMSYGIVSPRNPFLPRIYLLSAPVANNLKSTAPTGCEIIATNVPDCFQLKICAESMGPARVGTARIGKRCPVCGAAKMFLADSETYFEQADLSKTDFQTCRMFQSENAGSFQLNGGFAMTSARAFNSLAKIAKRGLRRYSTDPPINTAVVKVMRI